MILGRVRQLLSEQIKTQHAENLLFNHDSV